MVTKITSFRLDDTTREQLEALAERLNASMTDVVSRAVDLYYRHETGQRQYVVHRSKLATGDVKASVIDEAAYQEAVAGLPEHDYPTKPHRIDFVVWQGDADKVPDEYLE